jgi:hypothetical protein
LIVTYGCHVLSPHPPVVSNEHKRAGLFAAAQVPDLTMPDGYKRSIATWFAHLASEQGLALGADDGWPLRAARSTKPAIRPSASCRIRGNSCQDGGAGSGGVLVPGSGRPRSRTRPGRLRVTFARTTSRRANSPKPPSCLLRCRSAA